MAWESFISVFSIVGIILIGGGIVGFIGYMIIGAFNPNKKVKENKNFRNTDVMDYEEYKKSNEPAVSKDYDFEAINTAKAEKEKEMAAKEISDEDKYALLDDETDEDLSAIEERLKNSKAEEEINVDDLINEISNDVVEEEKQDSPLAPVPDESLNEYNIETYLEENKEEPVEEEPEEVVEDTTNEELESANATIAELQAQLADLNKQLEEARTPVAPVVVETVSINMTEEECLARLALLDERLKGVKKDYKINFKEYRPLKKVMTDLEKYQTKLRRKEAVVAKKKVALYGVNNYVDIDKEKAEKLANELELLDGLRLSVQHCEEVIEANKDRFPILEHTHNILTDEIAHIEADIEETNVTLAKIREQNGEGKGEGNKDGNSEANGEGSENK